MTTNYIFFDIAEKRVNALEAAFRDVPNVQCMLKAAQTVPVDTIVSPANSLGYMDGGIDMIYTTMFDGVERDVRARIAALNIRTPGKQTPYLPIGSALMVPVRPKSSRIIPTTIVVTPTMFTPQDVRDTENAYWAMAAILCVTANNTGRTVGIPALAMGTGHMSPKESAAQCRRAYDDLVVNGNLNLPRGVKVVQNDEEGFVLDRHACQQPPDHWQNKAEFG